MHTNPLTYPSVSPNAPSPRDSPFVPPVIQKQLSIMPSSKFPKKPKPPPLRLDTDTYCLPLLNPLVEFATFATSPQSPLVKNTTCDDMFCDTTSREQPHLEPPTSFPVGAIQNARRHGSACSSPYSPPIVDNGSASSSDDCRGLSPFGSPQYSWSASLWQRLKQRPTQYDELAQYRVTAGCSYPGSAVNSPVYTNSGIQQKELKTGSTEQQRTSSLFRPHTMKESDSVTPVTRPLVRGEGTWSPSLFADNLPMSHRDIQRELFLEDICLPLTRPPAEVVTSANKTEVLPTPEPATTVLFDLDSAAHALSSMAKRKEEYKKYHKVSTNHSIVKRKPGSRMRKKKNEVLQAKRPMNAFMLFAKRYRLEITQKHPGKDNRAISVILGDQWKSLSHEDRKTYIVEAKVLAEEHKKIYPDCWKRKRTSQMQSSSSRKC